MSSETLNNKLIALNELREITDIKAELEPKTFYEKYRILYLSCKYPISIICSIITIGTSYAYVNEYITDIAKRVEVSFFLSMALLIILEIIKRVLLDTSQSNYYIEHKFSLSHFVVLILVFGFSFWISFQGGAIARVQLFDEPPIYVNVDSAVSQKKIRLSRLENELENISQTMAWDNGNLTPDGRKAKSNTLEQIGILSNQISVEVSKLERHNEKISVEHEQEVYAKNRGFSIGVMVGDILLILSVLYKNYYKYRVFCEIISIKPLPFLEEGEGESGGKVSKLKKKNKNKKNNLDTYNVNLDKKTKVSKLDNLDTFENGNNKKRGRQSIANSFKIISFETGETTDGSRQSMQKEKRNLDKTIYQMQRKGYKSSTSNSLRSNIERRDLLKNKLKLFKNIRQKIV